MASWHRRGLPHGQSAAVSRPDRLTVNHAEDRLMMVDHLRAAPEKLADRLKPIERYIVLTDAAHMPATPQERVPYEEWIGEVDGDFA
jgi:fatty-acyl-CoA synthase